VSLVGGCSRDFELNFFSYMHQKDSWHQRLVFDDFPDSLDHFFLSPSEDHFVREYCFC